LTPILAVLLVHDLLLRNEIATTASHPLKLAITRHKARLNAEFVRARLRRGFSSVDALKASVNLNGGAETKVLADGVGEGSARCYPHPRWVRINTLRTTLKAQLETTFAEYSCVDSLASILEAPPSKRALHIDCHIPDLLALPPGADLTSSTAYMRGDIIFQDKASCFPAYLLDPSPEDEEIIDACAAPGNKTTHLAALLSARCRAGDGPLKSTSIWGFERDKSRAETLKKLVETAGASHMVTVMAGQDFLRVDPDSGVWKRATALLLDPSCSGSGIVGRDEMPRLVLPSRDSKVQVKAGNKKKRKRNPPQASLTSEDTMIRGSPDKEELPSNALSQRLSSLSAFQLKLLLHAFRFPSARKVVYSTCSIHAEENEHVVVKALNSEVAKRMGWRVLRREQQVAGLREWGIRGSLSACKGLESGYGVTEEVVAEACLRCSKGDKEGTMGFFVVGFVRGFTAEENGSIGPGYRDTVNWDGEDEEWEGFSDDNSTSNVVPAAVGLDMADRIPVGKKEKRKK
jgi:25S rRNA (cytosine2278-C5)-methyltransferase